MSRSSKTKCSAKRFSNCTCVDAYDKQKIERAGLIDGKMQPWRLRFACFSITLFMQRMSTSTYPSFQRLLIAFRYDARSTRKTEVETRYTDNATSNMKDRKDTMEKRGAMWSSLRKEELEIKLKLAGKNPCRYHS